MLLTRMWPSLLAALVMSAAVMAARAETVPVENFFNQSFWDFPEELQTARDEGKSGILIMFEMDECPFCHRMKTTVLNRADVQEYFRDHFLIFAVDIEGDVEITDFQGNRTTMKDFAFKQNRVRATPVFAFYDLEGKPMTRGRYTGATRDAEEFLLLGRYIIEGHNKTTSFTKFKRETKEGGAAG